MFERSRTRYPNVRGLARSGRFRRSRERSPPRLRSPVRERGRPRFERNNSRERFRRSRERSPRFERVRSVERFEAPYHVEQDPGRFEPPPREVILGPRSFENDTYRPPSPRFENRADMEPLMVERNINFECPADYDKFQPGPERHYRGIPAGGGEANERPNQSNVREESPPFTLDKEDGNDKNDPWVSTSGSQGAAASSSQLQPTFGQEKGSDLIPEFDPDTSDINVNTFLKLIDKVGQDKGWVGNDRKFQFSMKLKGAAKDWFLNGNKFLEPWSSIKKQFKANFPSDMDYHVTLTNMIQRVKRPDEDLSTYFNYKIVLLKNCGIIGRKAVSCLIGGLPDSLQGIRNNACDKNFAAAEDLYKFLIDQNIDTPSMGNTDPKCNSCGKRGPCDCQKIQNKSSMGMAEESIPRGKPIKCYKDVYITGKKLKCLLDESFIHNTVRECDIDFLKLRYKRQITIINGPDRSTLTSLGTSQILIRVDDLFTEMPFYVIKDNLQETPVVLGRTAIKYPHVTTRNGIFFTAATKQSEFSDQHEARDQPVIEIRNSVSPVRRIPHDHELSVRRSPERRNRSQLLRSPPRRSPPRRSPPGRLYKDSSLFINQFYGNPYA